jgi:serine/threonine-protein kinase
MNVTLRVTSGPHTGQVFVFDRHDTFLVGRAKDAHFKLSFDDPYFSRRHFLIELNPPRCRVLDLESSNGTLVNGRKIQAAEIQNGDRISAGTTVFEVEVQQPDPDLQATYALPSAASAESTTDHQIPDRPEIPGYEIQKELGRGGMGVVFEAKQIATGRNVAIKAILPALGVTGRQIDRFLRECRILEALHHPNIVSCQDIGEANGLIYLAMDLVNGLDAGKILKRKGPMEIHTAVRLICQVLSGLAHAHDQGFVHRDLKPANLLVDRVSPGKYMAKLADFGLARVFEASQMSGLTMQGEVGGTPAYMAPEQVTHYRDVNPAADQYSIAATLYKLLTDRYPHDLPAKANAALVHIISHPPTPIRGRRADIPERLAEIIHRALSREPGDRYSDVRMLQMELKGFA